MAVFLSELNESIETITEAADSGPKKYSIKGIFLQSESVNRNGRIYPKHLMEREIEKYITEKVSKNQALGELNHPLNRVNVDPREASHLIKELKFDGNDVRGVAKILDTPCGKIVKALMDENVSFGVSSRALGSLKARPDGVNEVQSDFSLRTVDIVSDPSAKDAWVTALHENKEWVMVNGIWTEQHMEQTQKIIRKASAKELNEVILNQFNLFIKSL
jgi:hypothetical protein